MQSMASTNKNLLLTAPEYCIYTKSVHEKSKNGRACYISLP